MTSRTKQRSSSLPCPLALLLFLTLAGLFVYAICGNGQFFKVISTVLLVSLGILLILRFELTRRQAALVLQKQDMLEKNNLLSAKVQKGKEIIDSLKEKI